MKGLFSGVGVAASALVVVIASGCASAESTPGPAGETYGIDSGGVPVGDDAGGLGGWNFPDGGTSVTDSGTGVTEGDASTRDAGTYDAPPLGVDAGMVQCNTIVNGTSSLVVNGTTRQFEVQLPTDTSSSMALLFLWHGWNQQAGTFASQVVYDVPSGQWVPFDPNAFPMPLLIVAPDDTGLFVVGLGGNVGLDWDIEPKSPPVDFPFFEAMLQCIEQQFTLDTSRIYSFGFSAGAVFTDLLSAEYPHLFAATISESGAWFNDPAEQQQVLVNNTVPFIKWAWPAFNPADKGNVLLTHGGPNDFATIISLENANEDALPFLYDNDRTVVECTHNFGHTLEPDLTQGMIYEYLWDHQLGGPPLTGLPADFPTQASPVGETSCFFHPAP
ncbi:MAG TPA: PHB depolymerase family esterase [Polyangiaceae bacterium]|nr:PHB depolymerase family esterase [Polyangiaceae bacterium]